MSYDIARPSGWDACCGGRRVEDFSPDSGRPLTTREVFDLLKSNQTGINVVVWFQRFILMLWLLTSLVPGFCLFDGAPGAVSSVSHIGWWAAIEVFVLGVGATSTYFGLHYTRDGVIEKGVDRTMTYLWFYQIVLILGIISHIVHDVLAWIAYSQCTSTLCTTQGGFLLTLCIVLIVLIIVLTWTAFVLVPGYRRNIKYSLAFGTNDMTLLEPEHDRPKASAPDEPIPEYTSPLPSAPEGDVDGGVKTPLLLQVRSENAAAARHGRMARYAGGAGGRKRE